MSLSGLGINLSLSSLVKKHKLVVMLFIGVLAIMLVGSTVQQSIVTPGWEIYNQICGIRCAAGVKTGAGEFTYPSEIGAAQWKVDVDNSAYGEPTIMIQSSDIRHVDFTGTVTPNDQPAQERTVMRGNHTYYLDYHIYMFDVSIRTVADRAPASIPGQVFGYPAAFSHETSWAYMSATGGSSTVGTGQVGKPFQGGAFVKFVISPWRGGTSITAPTDYVIQGAWSGVMNSYIQTKVQGQVENQWGEQLNPSSEAPMSSVGGLDNGAQVNMYQDAGGFSTQAPTINWDADVTPDTRIASTVVLYLPVQLFAGAYLTRPNPLTGEVTQVTPCDVYVKYTVRVDVLQTHDFVLQTAYEPPELNIPTDYFSWAKGFWDSLFSSPNFYFFIIIVAILVAMWIMFRGKKGGDGGSKRYSGLTLFDWAVIGVLGLLTFIPDPTDLLDFGLPIIEPLGAVAYYFFRRKGGGKT